MGATGLKIEGTAGIKKIKCTGPHSFVEEEEKKRFSCVGFQNSQPGAAVWGCYGEGNTTLYRGTLWVAQVKKFKKGGRLQ